MKKVILLLFIFILTYFKTNAQAVSLNNGEIDLLKNLVNSDPSAKATFEAFRSASVKAFAEQPNPVEEIMSEGLLAGNLDKIRSLKAVEDADKIYALALVYRVDGNKAYLNKATDYLQAWAKVNKSSGDPIDETKLEPLYAGYDLIRDSINTNAKKVIDKWLNSIADGEINSEHATGNKGTAINNWNSHRIKIIAMISYAIKNKSNYKIIEHEMTKQIGINLYADGSGYDFKERDALHYHIYTLEPLVMAATVIYRATGTDYFNYQSPGGSSIKKSMDFLVPFVTGEKTHGEFLNSTAAFDRARAKNGEAGYQAGAAFKPATGIYVLEEASYFDSKYLQAIKAVSPEKYNNDWQLLLNKVRKPFINK